MSADVGAGAVPEPVNRKKVLSYEEEKERKRRLRLLYHSEEEVKALEAKDFEVEEEKNKSKDQKKKEEFKALSFAEIRNMDNKERREYARQVLEHDAEVTQYMDKVRMNLEDE